MTWGNRFIFWETHTAVAAKEFFFYYLKEIPLRERKHVQYVSFGYSY